MNMVIARDSLINVGSVRLAVIGIQLAAQRKVGINSVYLHHLRISP